jgi:hypothetical protein
LLMCRTGWRRSVPPPAAWAVFWAGHLDLDAFAFDVTEHLTEWPMPRLAPNGPPARRNGIGGGLYGDDELLLSVPGMGPVTASVIRGFLADGSAFTSGKAAASYVRLNPSTWSSGTVSQPSRAITKEGPAVLRLAYFQAANAARAGSATGRVLPPADDRTRSLPHPGLRGGRPQTGRTDLDSAQPRHPLPDP